jgi:hypothetical protein
MSVHSAKEKAKEKENVIIADSARHFSRECPYQQKGKSKGTGFQGVCYNYCEKGHPASEMLQRQRRKEVKRKGRWLQRKRQRIVKLG